MSKIEEVITTNIDILHNNYKANNLSYKKFIDFFDKIGKLYLNFSDSIDSFFNKNISIIENQPISLHPLLLNTENIIKEQAKFYYNFSETINKNIINKYKLLKETGDKKESTSYKELKEYYKSLKKSKSKLEESQKNYQNKMKNLELLMISEDKQTKLHNNNKKKNINDLIEDCKIDESKYEKNISDVNDVLDKLREKEKAMIGLYKSSEQNRINKMKDEITIFFNDLSNINKKINDKIEAFFKESVNIEIEKDIITFEKLVEQNYKIEKNVQFISYEPITKIDLSEIIIKKSEIDEMFVNFKLITNLKKYFDKIYPEINIEETQNFLDFKLLCYNFLDKEKNISFKKEDFDKFLSLIKVEKYRSYFLSYLTKERSDGKLNRSEKLINELGIIFNEILILAEKEKNYRNVKNVLILSQTFYMKKDTEKDNNKKYIMEFLKENNWIRSLKFWEDIINYEIASGKNELIQKNINFDKAKLEESLQSSYYSIILTYSHNMCIFGIEQKLTLELCNSLVNKLKINDSFKAILEKTIEDIYNPKKKEININKEIRENKEMNKKEISKSEKINKDIIKIKENVIADDWVICTDEDKTNNNNNIFESFVKEDNNDFNETFDFNKKGQKAKKKKK